MLDEDNMLKLEFRTPSNYQPRMKLLKKKINCQSCSQQIAPLNRYEKWRPSYMLLLLLLSFVLLLLFQSVVSGFAVGIFLVAGTERPAACLLFTCEFHGVVAVAVPGPGPEPGLSSRPLTASTPSCSWSARNLCCLHLRTPGLTAPACRAVVYKTY